MIPFRLGVITDEISADLEHALDVMLEYGVREVELRELWGKNVLRLSAEEMAAARSAIQRRGMKVCSIASPFFKCSLGAAAGSEPTERNMHGAAEVSREEQLEVLKRGCEAAHFFGAPIVRVFSFWREHPLTPSIQAALRDAFVEPLQIADREGLVLGLENEHACLLGTGAETAPLLREINHPRLQCVWDPGNAFAGGEVPYPDGYEAVRGMVCHVHVKDGRTETAADRTVRRPWTVVGAGEIDYKGQFRALVEDKYTGVVSLETHYRGGGDAETSSRQCLEGIQKILSELS